MGVANYSDTILVPLSLFLTIGYHAYLWHNIKHKPSFTTIGNDAMKRKSLFQALHQGDHKKGLLAVQSLRNTLMVAILTATISIMINLALAALTSNSFNASHLFTGAIFGSKSGKLVVLKYASASLFSIVSFLCSSVAVTFLVDANYLINVPGEFLTPEYAITVLERGFLLSLFGNRLLCITFPLLLWMLGPVPVALASAALVWGLYELDFTGKTICRR